MRKATGLLVVVTLLVLIQTVFPEAAQSIFGFIAGNDAVSGPVGDDPRRVGKANSDKPGFPHVNFDDAKQGVPATEFISGASAVAGAVADFDSDGVHDLVTADTSGKLRVLKGNVDTVYPNSPEARLRRGQNGEPAPFSMAGVEIPLPFVPDFLAAGDLNGDGHSDILATARNAESLVVFAGNGQNGFSAAITFPVGGRITSIATGEIGRTDGQLDVSVAVLRENRPQVLIFEHPEGAFKYKPETFPLREPAIDVAIGNLDRDAYGDVAVAGGNDLTIVHGRGQAYPLDRKADLNISRPAAVIQTRQFPFGLSALAIGKFTISRQDSLAVLSNNGNIYTLEPQHEPTRLPSNTNFAAALKRTKKVNFKPADGESGVRILATLSVDSPRNEQEADEAGQLMLDSSIRKEDRENAIREKLERSRADFAKLPKSEQNSITSEKIRRTEESRQKRKEGFEQAISAHPTLLTKFKVESYISDTRLVNSAHSVSTRKLIVARVSDSGQDDLVLVDSIGKQIQIIAQIKDEGQRSKTELVSLEAETAPLAILPMRLNSDALSDLVILHENSPFPSVMMTSPANTFVVTTTDDNSGGSCDGTAPCALRRAMFIANTSGGADMITFNIGGGGLQTIHPLSELPDMQSPVTIDGTTQPGFAGTPIIEIKGDLLSGGSDGVSLKTSNSVIRGLVVNQMPFVDNGDGSVTGGEGIVVFSTSSFPNVNNNIVEGNYLGTDPTGTLDKGNLATGVSIFDADNNTIGGTTPQARNVMSGNGDYENTNIRGVGLAITGGNNNLIKGNYIGTNAAGTQKISNTYGVFFTGIGNMFGGDEAGAGNVVSGNGTIPDPTYGQCAGNGISVDALVALDTGEVVTGDNTFKGNLIGTNFNGTAPLGNCYAGISSYGNLNTVIGSITQNGRNTISDNGYDALWCAYNASFFFPLSGACYILGNNIGTDITGNIIMGNDQRNNACVGFCLITDTVWVSPSPIDFTIIGSPGGTTPGGDCTGFCNLVSGNLSQGFGGGGVWRTGFGFVFVLNNYLGVNRAGTAALPNFSGFGSYYGSFAFGAALSDGSGGFIDGGNLLSGNYAQGMFAQSIEPGGTFEIKGNLVGTSADGINGIPNGIGGTSASGIAVHSRPGTRVQVGGYNILERNVIAATISDGAGNRGEGLTLNTFGQVTVINNYIGMNKLGAPLPNTASGIVANGDGLAQIGGTGANEANFIKHNGKAGVFVYRFVGPFGTTPGKNVIIRGNSISDNGGLGIDLANLPNPNNDPDGVTTNDCYDEDDGANDKQNFPELMTPVFNGNGTVTVPGTLRSTPATDFLIDFYSNGSADPSDYGEGETHLGTEVIRTDGNGFASFTFISPGPVGSSQKITATAMDFFGNTSEFSCFAGQCMSGTLAEAIELAELGATCALPIEVTVNTDENDPNTADGVCDVDTGTSGLQCTLRAAIQEANARNGLDAIIFIIPGGGVQTISPATALPTITERVIIDGTSQPGYMDSPVIEVRGDGGTALGGLLIQTNKTKITGLAINRFSGGFGIEIRGNENVIERCHIGVSPNGLTADTASIQLAGVVIANTSSQNNRIGGSFVAGNVIGNNISGIFLSGSGVSNNRVTNNKIGTNKFGTAALPNEIGVAITTNASLNIIGGSLDSEANTISGNNQVGVDITMSANNNRVSGNKIGTDGSGNFPLRNGFAGVLLLGGANQNTIGGNQNERNIISGHTGANQQVGSGIALGDPATSQNRIKGNYIGTNRDGNAPISNGWGISVLGASNNTIGGDPNAGNLISANDVGIGFGPDSNSSPSDNTVSYNFIGTDSNNVAMKNRAGVVLLQDVTGTTISNNTLSGNETAGIILGSSSQGSSPNGNTIHQNKIGTDRDANFAVPNRHGIIMAFGSHNNAITGNVISGNDERGIWMGEGIALPVIESLMGLIPKDRASAAGPTLTQNNTIQGNLIGTDKTGNNAIPNGRIGIYIGENASNNQIGGRRSAQEGNTISGHTLNEGYGILLGTTSGGQQPTNNKIQGNRIGIKALSYNNLPNKKGIFIQNAADNFIGPDQTSDCGTNPGDISCDNLGNIIGGNETEAIQVVGSTTTNHFFANNFIGVAPDGTAIGNGGNGFTLSDDQSNSILDNTIGDNGGNGIEVQGTSPMPLESRKAEMARLGGGFITKISGNIIGLKKGQIAGSIRGIGNSLGGIKLSNAQLVLIGNLLGGNASKNMVSANGGPGILIEGANGSGNVIRDSIVGTDENGNPSVGNNGDGVKIDSSQNTIVGAENGTGLTGNVISGNNGNGIIVTGNHNTGQSRLLGNVIGVINRGGLTERLGNTLNGIHIVGVNSVEVGGPLAGLRNIVGGNQRAGILIGGQNTFTLVNKVVNNRIGTDDVNTPGLGNDADGVLITEQAQQNQVGGPAPNTGNVITNNGGAGVRIDETAGHCNLVDPNSIYGNGGLGIDIGPLRLTFNDAGDPDGGPNRGQNYPEIVSRQVVNDELIIVFKVDSQPGNSDYGSNGLYIEFFKADMQGEGEMFLGSTYYTTADHGGTAGTKTVNLGNIFTLGITANDPVTATATDAQDNTSEFFPPFGPTAAEVTVSGRVTNANGRPIAKTLVTLTDDAGNERRALTNGFGYYIFAGVQAGRTYILTARHKTYQFVRPSILLLVDDVVEDADFTALE